MGIAVAEAGAGDAEAVIGLWQACGLTRPWNDPQRDFDQALASPASTIFVARDDTAIVASAMVGFDGHRGWVYYLGVSPRHRHMGLGRRMMAAAESWLRERSARKIQFMVRSDNVDTLEFYGALGFERQDVVTLGRFLDP